MITIAPAQRMKCRTACCQSALESQPAVRDGSQYNLDWMLMAAQGYQESRLDQQAKSGVGAARLPSPW